MDFSEKKFTAISRLGFWEHFKKIISNPRQYLLAQKGDNVVKSGKLSDFEGNLKMDL